MTDNFGGREPPLDALGGFQAPVAHLRLALSCRYGFGVWRSINYHRPIPQQLLQCPNFSLSCVSLINLLALLAAWEEPLTACLIACLLLLGRAELSSGGSAAVQSTASPDCAPPTQRWGWARRQQFPLSLLSGDTWGLSHTARPSNPLPHTARPSCFPRACM